MKKYEAKTVEAAVELACEDLMMERESLMYEVTMEKKGLFSKKAEIMVFDLSDVIEYAENYIKDAIANFEIDVTTKSTISDDIIRISLSSDHNSVIIGKNGKTLQAINELTKLAVSSKFKRRFRILLDVGEYKNDKYQKIVRMAKRIARDVQKTKVTATLDHMPADERRVIHNALANMHNIQTESIGEGRKRQITIKYVD
ncbi:MAG: KH domain-containing protein [Erysipelotrichaceae bacterium]|nr:KH domain-containing protein [Erysipelotrichaceae bacterium]